MSSGQNLVARQMDGAGKRRECVGEQIRIEHCIGREADRKKNKQCNNDEEQQKHE